MASPFLWGSWERTVRPVKGEKQLLTPHTTISHGMASSQSSTLLEETFWKKCKWEIYIYIYIYIMLLFSKEQKANIYFPGSSK